MNVNNCVEVKAVATSPIDGLEVGKEYTVREIIMGQSNTSVYLEETNDCYNSIDFTFKHDSREIDIYHSSLFNPYMQKNGSNGICYVGE